MEEIETYSDFGQTTVIILIIMEFVLTRCYLARHEPTGKVGKAMKFVRKKTQIFNDNYLKETTFSICANYYPETILGQT